MPLADVEGSPALKFFRSTSCLLMSASWPCSFSSCLRTDATYCAFTGLEDGGFGLLFGSPTTETAPFAPERFSLVQTFFSFFVSAGVAESCDWLGDGGALPSWDCAAAETAAKRVKIIANESERGIKPPVSQGRGVCCIKPILGEKVSLIGGVRAPLASLGDLADLANSGEGVPGRGPAVRVL